MSAPAHPPIAAAFLVIFDQKVGYTIAWKKSLPDIDLDGVEYKSLPSGLHAVKDDLVYFVHGSFAGASVFLQGEADEAHRNAKFVAVGVLVPLVHGQLGRGWTHLAELRKLAQEMVKHTQDTRSLELFWKKHRSGEAPESPSAQPNGAESKKRKHAQSEAGFSTEAWPEDHPALYAFALLDTFGPLLFPLQRAALLRKRILFLGTPPVQRQGNTVYLTSVLSTIPRALAESLPSEAESRFFPRPIFSVGVREIPFLSDRSNEDGWLACTTDDIIGEKKDAWDLLVVLPSWQAGSGRQWPKLKTSDGELLKATQRDLRRWKLLRRELVRLKEQSEDGQENEVSNDHDDDGDDDERPLLAPAPKAGASDDTGLERRDESEIAEPSSWSALAYRGFMWWASAGEAQAWENEEAQADEELFSDLPDVASVLDSPAGGNARTKEERERHFSRAAGTLLVAYFRRLTERMMRSMASVVEEADDETEEGVEEEAIEIKADDMRQMGLDSWSGMDKEYVKELVKVWFNREAVVVEGGVKVCGLRVC